VRTGAWLALRELEARVGRAILAAALVALAAALGTGLELVARGREEAASQRIDGLGPALRIVPLGVGGSELARLELGQDLLPDSVTAQVSKVLGTDLREARARLVLQRLVSGRTVPVVGVGAGAAGRVALGSALAEALGQPSTIDLGNVEWPVKGVQEPTGTAEDGAVVLPLQAAQGLLGHQGINELQVFLRAGEAPREALSRLTAAGLQARVVAGARGAPADEEVQGALAKGRRLAQAVLALLVGLGLAVMAHLDAAERRTEIATLRAIGAGAVTVCWTLVARSMAVGSVGGAAGALMGAALAMAQDPAAWSPHVAWPAGVSVAALCAVIGVLAASPTALAMARRDPVPWLQEG
jgi:hypothetical protein